ncbi:Calx-beta domain-containing protein [Actinosynnema sp. NPDC023658]|uniref:Calx-beta domain-containing protein n=1 Tax=Actinosynnema sp. NPDC023658 TaxID=3155465 RepID=UPI0033F1F65E
MRLVLAVVAATGVVVPSTVAHATECAPARVAAADANNYEGTDVSSSLVFEVVATADAGCKPEGSVRYSVVADTASDGSTGEPGDTADFVAQSGTLTWTASSSATRTVSVTVRNDNRPEPDERVELRLSDATGLVVADPVAVGWLRDDDGMVARELRFDVDSGKVCWVPDVCRVRITFSVPLRAPVTLHYRTHDLTATAGQDYAGVKDTTLTVKTGLTSVLAPVTLLPHQSPQPDETFTLEVFAPSGGRVGQGTAPVTIRSGQ